MTEKLTEVKAGDFTHTKEIVHNNKEIGNHLEAWLAFFCMDEPEWILKLSENYPQFREMYEEIYEMCRNLEGVMQMYSKELRELDSNTVQYMIDEMQETINQRDNEIKEQAARLSQKDAQLSQKDREIQDQAAKLSQQNQEIQDQAAKLSQQESLIAELQSQLQEMQKHLSGQL